MPLSLHYHSLLATMSASCDVFCLPHALDCHKEGLVTQRHEEVRDPLGDLAALAYKDIICDPVVCEGDDGVPVLIADLGVRGVWFHQIEALFDVQVTDADVPSYLSRSVVDMLVAAEEEKKQQYLTAAEGIHASFSPFVVTVDGALGHEAVLF